LEPDWQMLNLRSKHNWLQFNNVKVRESVALV
jgi:hypothetical protein